MDGKFTLHGVKRTTLNPRNVPPVKILSRTTRKNPKIHTSITEGGYSFVVAKNQCVNFSQDNNGEKVCWWDHHDCDEFVRLPYKHESTKILGKVIHTFSGPGIFCDIFCMWAYIREEGKKIFTLRDPYYETAVAHTKLIFSLSYEATAVLKPAPDWRLLKRYGGHLTIEEFRKSSYNKSGHKLPNVVFEPATAQFLI